MRAPLVILLLGLICALSNGASAAAVPDPAPVSDALRQSLKLAPFYQKSLVVAGFPITSSAQVSDNALREAAWILQRMFEARPEVLSTLGSNGVHLTVMAWNEFTSDVPEHSELKPKSYWDRRARGLGATVWIPTASCAEENLLCHPGDPYSTENILIHEFAHAVHETGMNRLDPTFDKRLAESFHSATNRGLWKNTYAASNRNEYWAEGVQSWFDNNRSNDAQHNHVNTRALLKEYDPTLAGLCAEVFGSNEWRYRKPIDRAPADRAHLANYDPTKLPRFQWRPDPPSTPLPSPLYETRETHSPDGIGKFFLGREISHVMGHQGADWLERPEREEEEQPSRLVELLRLKAGDVVADIGAGTGYLSWRLASKVQAKGRVLAVDIQPEMIELLAAKMKERGVSNVQGVLGSIEDPKLPENSVDLVIMVDVYHEFSHPYEMMRQIVRSLKVGGRVVFVEYRGEDPNVPIKRLHKMTEDQVRKEASVHPLTWVETLKDLPRQHVIIFRKNQ